MKTGVVRYTAGNENVITTQYIGVEIVEKNRVFIRNLKGEPALIANGVGKDKALRIFKELESALVDERFVIFDKNFNKLNLKETVNI